MSFDLASLAVAGISYRQTPVSRRGALAVEGDLRRSFHEQIAQYGLPFGMVLSTCNRTEIYTDVSAMETALEIWARLTGQPVQTEKSLYMNTGRKAVGHLYRVTAGADSQIPGDIQITAQVKSAFSAARAAGVSTGLFERIINNAVHCSRKVKGETDINSGAASVPSAVMLAIKELYGLPHTERIAIVGLGKMGVLSCRNILKFTDAGMITAVNRTDARAFDFAQNQGTRYLPFSSMSEAVREAGIVIVSTASADPILFREHLNDGRPRVIFDLSVPHNVDPAVAGLPGVRLVDIDKLAAVARRHIQYRVDQLDQVQAIIDREVDSTFAWWQHRRRYVGTYRNTHPQRQALA